MYVHIQLGAVKERIEHLDSKLKVYYYAMSSNFEKFKCIQLIILE